MGACVHTCCHMHVVSHAFASRTALPNSNSLHACLKIRFHPQAKTLKLIPQSARLDGLPSSLGSMFHPAGPAPPIGSAPPKVTARSPCALALQGLSNILWAAARLGVQPPQPWLQRLYSLPAEQLQQMEPQAVASTLWALAVMCEGRHAQSTPAAEDGQVVGASSSHRKGATGAQAREGSRSALSPELGQQPPVVEQAFPLSSHHQGLPTLQPPPPQWLYALLSAAHTHMRATLQQCSEHTQPGAVPAAHAADVAPVAVAIHRPPGANSSRSGSGMRANAMGVGEGSRQAARLFGPQAVANTVWAAAKLLDHPPSRAWMSTFYATSAALVGRARHRAFGMQVQLRPCRMLLALPVMRLSIASAQRLGRGTRPRPCRMWLQLPLISFDKWNPEQSCFDNRFSRSSAQLRLMSCWESLSPFLPLSGHACAHTCMRCGQGYMSPPHDHAYDMLAHACCCRI